MPAPTDDSADCIFCKIIASASPVAEHGACFAFHDKYPVTDGHLLIVPKRHAPDYFSLTADEKKDADYLLHQLREAIQQEDPSVTGFNIGINNGFDAGQTVFHCHIHLIPRRKGDCENPRGGVRGVIPGKRGY
ncbi:HIT family protein [Desulfovibrio mangrovi]|uniref:HIT family protein n=1 Tax=Desulfovibrio mangrovi TaxID=2976983 RepID=UPI00224736F0|nr:HIT family protein [Desulfovibrio mangrovi]UZP67588.1 HIT family protein [Desulfovibrio mangrovi]